MFSDLTKERLRKFKSLKRGYYSFWILLVLFVLSLFSEHLANDRPLVLHYEGEYYFPTLKFYSEETFGGRYKTEADYKKLKSDPGFSGENWMVFPPIPHDPFHSYLNLEGAPPHPPSSEHWLGTDNSARDVFARLLYGFRICMLFSLSLAGITTVIGVIIGAVQGYLGGRVDLWTQRMIEVWSALPFLYVVILLGSIYGQNFTMLLAVMSLFSWIGLSYYMRGEFLKLRNQTYVVAARALGVGHIRILLRQMLPNALTPVITILPFTIVGGISSLTSLDFLGFGLPPPTPSWGELIDQGLKNLQAPWLAFSAVTALFVTLLLAAFVGEGLRAAFDPKSLNKIS